MLEALDIKIACGPDAPAHARWLVGNFARDRVTPAMRENAQLLVSEIASNAVIHTRASAALRLRLTVDDGCLHVAVTDGGPGFSPPAHPQPREGGGFGLYLLDCAADRWGVALDSHCRVWFELDAESLN